MEDRILELEERIERLERKEKRRKTFAFIKLILIILIIAGLVYGGYKLYTTVEETIKPYKEIIDKKNEVDKSIKSIKDLFK